MRFPCSPVYPALRRKDELHCSSRWRRPAWENPRGPFASSCPANRLYRRPLLLPPRSSVLALLPRSPGLAPAGLEDEEGEPAARERAVGRRGAPAQWQPSCSSRSLRSSFAPQTPPNLTATLGRRPGLWRLPHFVAADTLGLGSEATCPRPHRRDG